MSKITEEEQINSNARAQSAQLQSIKTQEFIATTIAAALIVIFALLGVIFFDLSRLRKKRQELKLAKEEAEKMAEAKQEFLSTMSHEIRTPLTAIIGFTDQLADTTNEIKRSEYLEIIRNSSDHLLSVVNDILEYARLESGTVEIEPVVFSPAREAETVVALFAAQAKQKNLALNYHSKLTAGMQFIGDAFRYKQILINLVANAVKFTGSGTVEVSLSSQMIDGQNYLKTSVIDSGIGIPNDRMRLIFDRFEQADMTTTRRYGGTGLGLSIVQKLVHLLGGYINIDSKLGEGSTFTFTIPFETAETTHEPPNRISIESSAPDLGKLHVLLVDDEPYNLRLMRTILENNGARVQTAESAVNGMDAFYQHNLDLAIIDIQMPEINGLEMAKTIRKLDSDQANIPLMASTAALTKDDISAIKSAGYDDWIEKPFKPNNLIQKVISLVADTPSQNPASDSKQLDSLNIDDLIKISQGNIDFVVNMLQLYLSSTEDNFNQLKAFIGENDLTNIELVAHKMIAPTRHLGLNYFTNSLKRLEKTAREEDSIHSIKRQFDEITLMWQRIEPLVKMKLAELQTASTPIQ